MFYSICCLPVSTTSVLWPKQWLFRLKVVASHILI
uniref:Uncharacterized protein n=1 Tax=Arundo donax TaxID=35708 RepID=A0A0A9HB58_ARUDO